MASVIGWILVAVVATFTAVGVLGVLGTSVLLGVRRLATHATPAVAPVLDVASARRAA